MAPQTPQRSAVAGKPGARLDNVAPDVNCNCVGEGRVIAGRSNATGGKSGLHRAGCWVTPRGGNATDQCHRKQTAGSQEPARVKR